METQAVKQTGNRDGHEVTPAHHPTRDFDAYPHRGATACRVKRGNQKIVTRP